MYRERERERERDWSRWGCVAVLNTISILFLFFRPGPFGASGVGGPGRKKRKKTKKRETDHHPATLTLTIEGDIESTTQPPLP